jgi:hypothetical protein
MLPGGDACDPVSSLLWAYPTGCILLRDSLVASAHFLLPWITSAAVKQGHKVREPAAAEAVVCTKTQAHQHVVSVP